MGAGCARSGRAGIGRLEPLQSKRDGASRFQIWELLMHISVSGKNMDTGTAFQSHAEDALNSVVGKYFDNAVSGNVTLEKANSGFCVKTRVALSRRIELEATGFAHEAHAALDAAIEHAEKRLRRHKRRLKNHRSAITEAEANEVFEAPMKVYAGVELQKTQTHNKQLTVLFVRFSRSCLPWSVYGFTVPYGEQARLL